MRETILYFVLCGFFVVTFSEQQQQCQRERIVFDPTLLVGSKMYMGNLNSRRLVNSIFRPVPHELEEQLVIYLDLYDEVGIKEGVFYAKDTTQTALDVNGIQFTFRKLRDGDDVYRDMMVIIVEDRTIAGEIANKIKQRT